MPWRWLVEDDGLRPVGEAFVGMVVAAVRNPKDVQLVCRIVQRKAVAHLVVYDIFFVVGGDEQGQFGNRLSSGRGGMTVLRKHSFSLTRT